MRKRSKRFGYKGQLNFDSTFDTIMAATIALMCLLASLAMFAALYLIVALLNTL